MARTRKIAFLQPAFSYKRSMKQQTILRDVAVKGKALHTGQDVILRFKPAKENSGIIFRRVDLVGHPEIRPDIDRVGDLVRCTTVCDGDIQIHTVEHVASALVSLGIDNIVVELDASEPPILDGSAKEYVNLLLQAEIVPQDADRDYFSLRESVCVSDGNRSLIALPYDGLKITCTSADDRGIHTQHLSLDISPEIYSSQIAAARTFTLYEDIEPLLKLGKIQGGSLDSAIVIKGDKILSKEPLRFRDEFVRHKMLDLLGDLMLLGKPLRAHIIALRPGHALNAQLTRAIKRQMISGKLESKRNLVHEKPMATVLNIRRILNLLPHRYPFLLIDRVVEMDQENRRLVAIKNVSINEPYFLGHFPGRPVMPGVLQLEAMAQAAGALMLKSNGMEGKLALFMSCDRVKFRRIVEPGDQLEIEVKILKHRSGKIGVAEGTCRVAGQIVSSAELTFALVDDQIE